MGKGGQFRVLFAGGGTAGHLIPAINIALEMKQVADNFQALFVGRKGGMETNIVADFGFGIKEIQVAGLKRTPLGLARFLWNWRRAQKQASLIVEDFDPLAVVGTGGYLCAPVVRAAFKLRKPIFLQEQNSVPGLATRTLSRMAETIFVAYDSAARHLPAEKCRLVGNPLRPDITDAQREASMKLFGLDPGKNTLLVLGGSLGAGRINQSVLSLLTSGGIPDSWQLLWQTGRRGFEQVKSLLGSRRLPGAVLAFIDNMPSAYAASDLVLSRAGAMTLAEIAAWGLPSILIPYPHATGDHQTLNARESERARAAVVVAESEIERRLRTVLQDLFSNNRQRLAMGQAARRLAKPGAAKIIAGIISERINEVQKN